MSLPTEGEYPMEAFEWGSLLFKFYISSFSMTFADFEQFKIDSHFTEMKPFPFDEKFKTTQRICNQL